MSRPHIIGLCGFAGAGKDTVADVLVKHCGFQKLAFADALRAEVANGFNVSLNLLTERAKKEISTTALALHLAPTEFLGQIMLTRLSQCSTVEVTAAELSEPASPRQIMQLWGTEYRRRQDPDYWVKQLTARLSYAIQAGGQRFVVTDCRFANEAAGLRAMGGVLWQVQRPGISAATTPEGTHVSATDGTEFAPDATIVNHMGLHELKEITLQAWWAREANLPGLTVELPQ